MKPVNPQVAFPWQYAVAKRHFTAISALFIAGRAGAYKG
jgi:hypothetical protein